MKHSKLFQNTNSEGPAVLIIHELKGYSPILRISVPLTAEIANLLDARALAVSSSARAAGF